MRGWRGREYEVVRVGRLPITRTIFALVRDTIFSVSLPCSLTFSLGFLMGLLLCCHSNSMNQVHPHLKACEHGLLMVHTMKSLLFSVSGTHLI